MAKRAQANYRLKAHLLKASSANISVGRFENKRPPVLRVANGDAVSIETLNHFADGISENTSIEEVIALRKRGGANGPHTVTGPVYVLGASPGDSLKISIGRIRPRRHGYNFHLPGKEFPSLGTLPREFPEGQIRHFKLDLDRRRINFSPGIHIPLRPFPGIVAVSAPDQEEVTTIAPGPFGGNMDLKELTEGAILYLPVFVEGALLWVGDAHATQGDGEVNLTAVECAFESIELTVSVLKGMQLRLPRAETPTHWITMGFHTDLNEAFRAALREMIEFLCINRGLTRGDAYALCSVAVDFRVTQVVDGNKGIHGMLPKSIFSAKNM